MTADLTCDLAGLTLANPVMTASGCAGTGPELDRLCDLADLGAFVTRSVTLDSRAGWAPPRLVETPGGVLGATGLQGPGLQAFLATELTWLAQRRVRTVVSIAGSTLGEYGELARRVGNSPGVAAVEVNLATYARDPYQAAKVLSVVRRDVPRGIVVLAKLSAEVTSLVDVARAVVDAGADALVLVHGPTGLALAPATLRPELGGTTGELSGPAVHSIAVRCVWHVHAAMPDVPLVGVGGIRSGFDALEMLAVGASAVQVGTAVLADPSAAHRVIEELRDELERRGITSVAEVVGRAHQEEES